MKRPLSVVRAHWGNWATVLTPPEFLTVIRVSSDSFQSEGQEVMRLTMDALYRLS